MKNERYWLKKRGRKFSVAEYNLDDAVYIELEIVDLPKKQTYWCCIGCETYADSKEELKEECEC